MPDPTTPNPRAGVMARILARLANRVDSEHEQGIIRIVIGLLILGYFAGIRDLGASPPTGLWIAIAFLAISVALFVCILVNPAASHIRRVIGIVTDVSALTACVMLSPQWAAVLWGLYLWIPIGNGFRFGKMYLLASEIVSVTGFAIAAIYSGYWNGQPWGLRVGLCLTLLVIPLYVLLFLRRIDVSNKLTAEARREAELATEKAVAASSAKSRFLAVISHEMRTPLNGVIGTSELLQSTRLDDEQRTLAGHLHQSGQALLSLIENVLDISKIEAGKLVTESIDFDLYALIETTLSILGSKASEKGLALHVQILPQTPYALKGDPHHLRQILLNLIGNAIKFTECGEVKLRITPLSEESDLVRIKFSVSDTGIGIAHAAQARIFDSFTQADSSTTRRYGGTGLGTTIAKQLVELMGGKIGLISEPGKGSVFWFDLPFARRAIDEGDLVIHTAKLDERRILFVGTPSTVLESCLAALGGWGIAMSVSANLAAAKTYLAQAAQNGDAYGLVLVDGALGDDVAASAPTALQTAKSGQQFGFILLNAQLCKLTDSELLAAGYHSWLPFPTEKPLLFNALHAGAALTATGAPGVVRLIERYKDNKRARKRILVAEDNETNRIVISKVLERADYEVTLVNNGEEALDALERDSFDVAIVDMQMPVMGGIEAVQLFRFTRPDSKLPFILLTGNATAEAEQEAERAGIKHILFKPLNSRQLFNVLDSLVATPRVDAVASVAPANPPATEPDGSQAVLRFGKLKELEQLGDSKFVTEVVETFCRQTEQTLLRMDAGLRTGDYEEFKGHAHAVRGGAVTLGLNQLAASCKVAESQTHEALQRSGTTMLTAINGTYRAAAEAIANYLQSQAAANEK
jgi:two-component system, sensor histidine kinase RpfC